MSKFLLEDGSGAYLLEDGSGYYLLEAEEPAGGFSSSMFPLPFGFGKAPTGGGGVVVNVFSGRGGGAASPLVG